MEWILLSILCAIVTSLIIVLSKPQMYNHESLEFAASTRLWVLIFSIPLFAYFFNILMKISASEIELIYISSLVDSLAYWLTFKSVKHIPIERISPFLYLEVVFVFLFGIAFFKEVPSTLGIMGILVVLLSILLIQYKTNVGFRALLRNAHLLKYTTIILLSTVYYALFKILSRYILHYKNINFIQFVILLNLFNVINSLMLIYVVEKYPPTLFLRKFFLKDKITALIGFFILLQIITEYGAYLLASDAAYVSAIKMLYVVFSIFLASIFYKEKYPLVIYLIAILSFIGVGMIILA